VGRDTSDFTPEELRLAQRLLDDRIRATSQEQYRRMVADNDPALQRGPVRLPQAIVEQLRGEVAVEVRARRTPPTSTVQQHRWPWQRR